MSLLQDRSFRRRLGYLCLGLALGFVILSFIQRNRPPATPGSPGLFPPPPVASPVSPAPAGAPAPR